MVKTAFILVEACLHSEVRSNFFVPFYLFWIEFSDCLQASLYHFTWTGHSLLFIERFMWKFLVGLSVCLYQVGAKLSVAYSSVFKQGNPTQIQASLLSSNFPTIRNRNSTEFFHKTAKNFTQKVYSILSD